VLPTDTAPHPVQILPGAPGEGHDGDAARYRDPPCRRAAPSAATRRQHTARCGRPPPRDDRRSPRSCSPRGPTGSRRSTPRGRPTCPTFGRHDLAQTADLARRGPRAAVLMFRTSPRLLEWATPYAFGISVLCSCSRCRGTGAGTAASERSWITIGGLRLGQPAELAKLAVIPDAGALARRAAGGPSHAAAICCGPASCGLLLNAARHQAADLGRAAMVFSQRILFRECC